MGSLYIYAIYGRNKIPLCIGIDINDKLNIFDLYQFNNNKLYKTVLNECRTIRDIIIKANDANHRIVTTDFKMLIKTFDLPLTPQPYNVYDLHLPDIKVPSNSNIHNIIKLIIDNMKRCELLPYQKLIANSAVVYHDWENRGVIVDYVPLKPKWSTKTYTGRSKTLEFNIQNHNEESKVYLSSLSENNVLIHFDWICADIRVAALLSGDKKLEQAFVDSDPYTFIMQEINKDSANSQLSRDDSKQFLLKSINAMDLDSLIFSNIFQDLGVWIKKCKKIIESNKSLKTILGRRFNIDRSKNQLSVLNGIMQGSVAHGMQSVIRNLWEKIPGQLITEVHDSLIISCEPTASQIRSSINLVTKIMLYPFAGYLDENPVFPLKVSIGKKWQKWKLIETYYADRIINHESNFKKD